MSITQIGRGSYLHQPLTHHIAVAHSLQTGSAPVRMTASMSFVGSETLPEKLTHLLDRSQRIAVLISNAFNRGETSKKSFVARPISSESALIPQLIDPATSLQAKSLFKAKYTAYIDHLREQLACLDMDRVDQINVETYSEVLDQLKTDLEQLLPAFTFFENVQLSFANLRTTVQETLFSYQTRLTDTVSDLFTYKYYEDSKIGEIVNTIKEGKPLLDDDLVLLNEKLLKKRKWQADKVLESKLEFESQLRSLINKHPHLTKGVVRFVAATLGIYMGGARTGFTLLLAANRLMDQLLPTQQKGTDQDTALEMARFFCEVVFAYYFNGKEAALTIAANYAFRVAAPEHVQKAVEVAAVAQLGHEFGLSYLFSIWLSFSSVSILRNLKMGHDIVADFRQVLSASSKNSLMIIPHFFVFAGRQMAKNFHAVRLAASNGEIIETAIRVALFAGASFSLMTLSTTVILWPLIFYLVNKSYTYKYEGSADLNNPSFRAYVLQAYHEAKNGEALMKLLEEEANQTGHEDLKAFNKALQSRIEGALMEPEDMVFKLVDLFQSSSWLQFITSPLNKIKPWVYIGACVYIMSLWRNGKTKTVEICSCCKIPMDIAHPKVKVEADVQKPVSGPIEKTKNPSFFLGLFGAS